MGVGGVGRTCVTCHGRVDYPVGHGVDNYIGANSVRVCGGQEQAVGQGCPCCMSSTWHFGAFWVPSMVGMVPSMVGVVPSMVGLGPSMIGVVPSMVGVAPSMVGLAPSMVGVVPSILE